LPIKADTEVSAGDIARLNLVLIGNGRLNRIVRRLQDRLPLQDTPEVLTAGKVKVSGKDRAYRLIHPNPLAAGRLVMIYGAETSRGLGHFARFSRGSAKAWPPEPNVDYLVLDPAGEIKLAGVFRDRWRIGE
jgi:hypothetical protein